MGPRKQCRRSAARRLTTCLINHQLRRLTTANKPAPIIKVPTPPPELLIDSYSNCNNGNSRAWLTGGATAGQRCNLVGWWQYTDSTKKWQQLQGGPFKTSPRDLGDPQQRYKCAPPVRQRQPALLQLFECLCCRWVCIGRATGCQIACSVAKNEPRAGSGHIH